MSKTDWYRRATWSDADREDFNIRLKRCRGDFSKAQYLRIQAFHLAEAGRHKDAIELLDRMLTDFPVTTEIASAREQKAISLAKLGHSEAAIEEFRTALQYERDFPNVRGNAWLEFGLYVVEKQLTQLYGEVASVLEEFRDEAGLSFPANEFRYATIQAILAGEREEKTLAREYARKALAEADKVHSGLRYHPTAGIVGAEQNRFANRLRALAVL